MLKENWRLIARMERSGDFLIVVVCFFAAYFIRDWLGEGEKFLGVTLPFKGRELAPLKDYFTVLVVALVGYLFLLHAFGAYRSMRLTSLGQLVRQAFLISFIVFLVLAATLFLLRLDLSRSFIGLFCALVACSFAFERALVLRLLRYWRASGRNFRNIIICGVGEQAAKLAWGIISRPELGIRVRSFADLRPLAEVRSTDLQDFRSRLLQDGVPQVGRILHGVPAVTKALREYAIDEVIFADVVNVMPAVEEVILACADQGVRTTIAADLFSLGMVKSGISYFCGTPLIHFQTPPGDRWELGVKRLIDLAVGSCLLLLSAPLGIAIACAIKCSSRGPVFFRQTRMGLNGRLFSMYKFRSMRVGSEKQLSELRERNEMQGPVFKVANDPRVTPVGWFLRRFSLDELPQLWNVVRGDMSLVGPRPPVPGEVSMYDRKERRRLSMRPGLTCTWQVSGRNEIRDFETWVRMDLEYIDNWSLWRDFWLLLRTVPAVLTGRGAR